MGANFLSFFFEMLFLQAIIFPSYLRIFSKNKLRTARFGLSSDLVRTWFIFSKGSDSVQMRTMTLLNSFSSIEICFLRRNSLRYE